MRRLGKIAFASAIVAAGSAHALLAQLPGIPYGPVNTGLGINVAADYGHGTGSPAPSAWGLTGGLGVSSLGISASFGGFKSGVSGAPSQTIFGGMAGMRLFGGGLMPISIGAQFGAGYQGSYSIGTASYSSTTNLMPAAWVKVSPPLFPLKPWGQVYYLISNRPLGTSTTTKSEVRVSVGANFNLLLGLGVHAAYDWGDKGGKRWGVGAHFNFRVPSLGVPGVPGM